MRDELEKKKKKLEQMWFVYPSGREVEGGTRLYEQVRSVMFKYWQERR